MRLIAEAMDAARKSGGLFNWVRRVGLALSAASTFVRMYFLPVRSRELPADPRLEPVW